jgi:small GTP-binding protein
MGLNSSKSIAPSIKLHKPYKPQSTFSLKFILVGDTGVGKSCILSQFIDGRTLSNPIVTIGIDFKGTTIRVDNETRVKLQIWDTSGPERFRNITTSYYRGVNGFLLVYDITNQDSFLGLRNWKNDIDIQADLNKAFFIVVGNKADSNSRRQVQSTEGYDYAQSIGAHFFEVSSNTGSNIKESIYSLACSCLGKHDLAAAKGMDWKRKLAQRAKQTTSTSQEVQEQGEIENFTMDTPPSAQPTQTVVLKDNSPTLPSVSKLIQKLSSCLEEFRDLREMEQIDNIEMQRLHEDNIAMGVQYLEEIELASSNRSSLFHLHL